MKAGLKHRTSRFSEFCYMREEKGEARRSDEPRCLLVTCITENRAGTCYKLRCKINRVLSWIRLLLLPAPDICIQEGLLYTRIMYSEALTLVDVKVVNAVIGGLRIR